MIIAISIFGVFFLAAILALLIKRGRGSRRVRPGDERFNKVGPGEVKTGDRPRTAGID